MDFTSLGQVSLILLFNTSAAAAILIAGWILSGWLGRMVGRASEAHPAIDRTLASVFAKVVRYAILIFTVVAVLNRFGVQTTSIVALLGAAGLAIGLALQGALANVAAGVMILTLRPFRLGDAVDIGGSMGVVEEIDLFVTRLRTFDGVVIHQPNAKIWGTEIKNFSQAERRRVDLRIGIGYGDDAATAIGLVERVLAEEPRVLADPAPVVTVETLGESSVNLLIRFWTLPADLFPTQWAMTRSIKEAFDAGGVSIPFPQRELHMSGGAAPVSGERGN